MGNKPRRTASACGVDIQIHTARWKTLLRPYTKTVRAAVEAAFEEGFRFQASGISKKEKYEITVVLADDAFIKGLNKQYRGKDKATNVLSFASSPDPRAPIPDPHVGDIVLALQTIEREASVQNKSFKAHAQHLVVHGVLHLLGYDHTRHKAAEIMERMEIKIMKKLGVSNPYLS